jgi:MFS family permease
MVKLSSIMAISNRRSQTYIVSTAFLSLFAIVGFAYYGLPFFYDFMVKEYGWSRSVVTSGNALGKLIVGPLFGFIAGWLIDRFGPRRLMISGILFLTSTALIVRSQDEKLSPGQKEEIDRIYKAYPKLNDDVFVAENIDKWLS